MKRTHLPMANGVFTSSTSLRTIGPHCGLIQLGPDRCRLANRLAGVAQTQPVFTVEIWFAGRGSGTHDLFEGHGREPPNPETSPRTGQAALPAAVGDETASAGRVERGSPKVLCLIPVPR